VKKFMPMMTTVEAGEAASRDTVVLLPVGTMEVNGPHLPLGYDYLVAARLAEAVCEIADAIWLPPITYGISEALASFPGTVWITPATLGDQVERILLSLVDHGFKHILILNNHIPNQYPVEYATRSVRRKTGVIVASVFPAQLARDLTTDIYAGRESEIGHGGEPSTSLMLHLHPEAVRMDLASANTIRSFDGLNVISPLEVQFGQSRVNLFLDVGDLSDTGGWGDPTRASAEVGAEVFDRMVRYVSEFVATYRKVRTDETS
jgi:creatinine amidohydrolase